MIRALQSISHDGLLPSGLKDYCDQAPKVARFSFSVSQLTIIESGAMRLQ